MSFQVSGFTSIGAVRPVNQDSYCIKCAQTTAGEIMLAVVADGVGGLAKGELASATAVRAFGAWFDQQLPKIVRVMGFGRGFLPAVKGQWEGLLQSLNVALLGYAQSDDIQMGTTLTAVLAWGNQYVCLHVGDSRFGRIDALHCEWLTCDQVAEQEGARVLVQAVGAVPVIVSAVREGTLQPGVSYVLCTDGFYGALTPDELVEFLQPARLDASLQCMDALPAGLEGAAEPATGNLRGASAATAWRVHLEGLAKMAMARGEKDNITAVVFRLVPQGAEDAPHGEEVVLREAGDVPC